MTREEAIKMLKDRIEQYTGGVHPGEREILIEAFAALRCPQPDPDTGLTPCGCGGKADLYTPAGIDGVYSIKCGKCRVMIPYAVDMDKAINEWNTAMGWRGKE